MLTNLDVRMIQKADTQEGWDANPLFVPFAAEFIVYKPDDTYSHSRFKLGDGVTPISQLPFIDATLSLSAENISYGSTVLASLLDTLTKIDYEADLAFDTSEIVISSSGNLPTDPTTTSVLGKAMLGYLVLA